MGSSSSHGTAGSTMHTEAFWYDGRYGEYGNVNVRSRKVKGTLGVGVHHFITCEPGDGTWLVYEWTDKGKKFYKCKYIYGRHCLSLGRYKVSDVYKACEAASYGARYGTNYNCNDWTEYAAKELGWNIKVHWCCTCNGT